jgi:hypothetical protein
VSPDNPGAESQLVEHLKLEIVSHAMQPGRVVRSTVTQVVEHLQLVCIRHVLHSA